MELIWQEFIDFFSKWFPISFLFFPSLASQLKHIQVLWSYRDIPDIEFVSIRVFIKFILFFHIFYVLSHHLFALVLCIPFWCVTLFCVWKRTSAHISFKEVFLPMVWILLRLFDFLDFLFDRFFMIGFLRNFYYKLYGWIDWFFATSFQIFFGLELDSPDFALYTFLFFFTLLSFFSSLFDDFLCIFLNV